MLLYHISSRIRNYIFNDFNISQRFSKFRKLVNSFRKKLDRTDRYPSPGIFRRARILRLLKSAKNHTANEPWRLTVRTRSDTVVRSSYSQKRCEGKGKKEERHVAERVKRVVIRFKTHPTGIIWNGRRSGQGATISQLNQPFYLVVDNAPPVYRLF